MRNARLKIFVQFSAEIKKVILLYTDLQGKGFSVVLSDMCPAVSGITTKDAALSIELGMRALSLAVGQAVLPTLGDCHEELPEGPASEANDGGVLLPGGNLVIKLLESEDVQGGQLFLEELCDPDLYKLTLSEEKNLLF